MGAGTYYDLIVGYFINNCWCQTTHYLISIIMTIDIMKVE